MGKYIYEGHMGNFFTTSKEIDYEDLYCESCGDCDTYIGYAENAEEAWELLKNRTNTFDDSVCEGCKHKDDYEYCEEHCKEYEKSFGSYGVSYVMDFICEEFKPKNVHEIYLVCREKNHNDYIFVNFKPIRYKFGERHSLPHKSSFKEEFVDMIARGMTVILDDEDMDTFKLLCKKKVRNKTIHIYECREDKSKELEWNEKASYHGDGWYGYAPVSDIKLIDEHKDVERILKLRGVENNK